MQAGQITAAAPAAVLDLFVDQHTLVRAGGAPAALSFQHQQFQEWYASFEVEQVIRKAALGDRAAQHRLRADILDQPAWEESILFACERASRDDPAGIEAVAARLPTFRRATRMLRGRRKERGSAIPSKSRKACCGDLRQVGTCRTARARCWRR